jgi:hypothetical protein
MPDSKSRARKRSNKRPNPSPAATPVTEAEIKVKIPAARWYEGRALDSVAALTFACMVAIMWGAYSPGTGLPFETAFPYTSETTSALRGFLYDSDPMRLHTSTFYHLGYLLSEVFGIRGSYVPFQIVYALLWWARGTLVYAILRKFLPECPSLCYCAGALTIIHSSDGAMMLVEQMNQFGFIFWMLLAMYCFLLAWDSSRRLQIAFLAAIAAAFEYMSLWSYESQILLILIFPVVTMMVRHQWKKPARLMLWYAVPVVYLVETYQRYKHSGGHSYQESVLRKSWSVASIASDWAFNIFASLKFWGWGSPLGWRMPANSAYALSLITGCVFAAGWVAIIRLGNDQERPNPFAASIHTCWSVLAGGFAALALSFPVYLLLNSARGLWRTQFLSGIGAGIVFAGILGLISWVPLRRFARITVVIATGACIAYFGSVFALEKAGVHRYDWNRHRRALLEIARFAPSVQPGTVVVLTNVPKGEDPFFDNLWFDLGLRLMYPGTPVAGVYFFTDGSPGTGNNLVLAGDSWRWDGQGYQRLFAAAPIAKTIVVRYNDSGEGTLLSALPEWLCKSACAANSYNPYAAIRPGPMSPIAIHRFGAPGR